MNDVTIIEYHGYSTLKSTVKRWISENDEKILEVLKIEYESGGDAYLARIIYRAR